MNKKRIESIQKLIKQEMKDIEKEYNPGDWDFQEVDRMDAEEAFNRGIYRAYNQILSLLNTK